MDYANTTNVEFIVDPKVLFHGWLIYSYLHLSWSSDCQGSVQIGSLITLWHDHIACIDNTACPGGKIALWLTSMRWTEKSPDSGFFGCDLWKDCIMPSSRKQITEIKGEGMIAGYFKFNSSTSHVNNCFASCLTGFLIMLQCSNVCLIWIYFAYKYFDSSPWKLFGAAK